ncbi:MAG: hypothetical protein NT015_09960 [Alphaproteobacteria bacterium]|nr:hypothetical protein [Alphaproteobacteria bacterium]
MRRLAGWGARILRYAGKIAELFALLGFLVGLAAGSHGGGVSISEFPAFWSETRRGWLKGIRGWYRSTLIASPLLAPVAMQYAAVVREGHTLWFSAIGVSLFIFGGASIVIAPIAVHAGRALSAPRPYFDIATTCAGAFLLALGLSSGRMLANTELVLWTLGVGVVWGWLYWFFAHRPRPPYLSDDR